MRRFLIWLSGARWDLLAYSPGDRAKYEGVGGAILITATLAGVSMTFALNTALNVFLPLAILAGAAWSLAIMQLDRWLVVSIQRRSEPWKNLYPAVPRLLLALLFGVVISTPLVLQIFRPEIEAKIVELRQNDADAFRRQQQSGAVGATISRLSAQRDALQKIVASGGDTPQNPEADPKVVGLRSQLTRAETARDKAYKEWRCQLYGPCKPTGPGPLAAADEQAYRTAQRQVNKINGQIEDRKAQLTSNDQASRAQRVSDAKTALPQVQSRLADYTTQQQALQRTFDAKNRGSAGLLMRLKALDEVSKEDSTLNTARLLLLLLFTTIECLPVFVKLLLTFGPENNYERILALAEQEEITDATIAIQTGRRRDETGAQEVLNRIWGEPREQDHTRGFPPGDDPVGPQAPHKDPDRAADRVADAESDREDWEDWEHTRLENMPDGTIYQFSRADSDPHRPADDLLGFEED